MLIGNYLPTFWCSLFSLEHSPEKVSRVEKLFALYKESTTISPKKSYFSLPTWKMEAAICSEILVIYYQSKRWHIQ